MHERKKTLTGNEKSTSGESEKWDCAPKIPITPLAIIEHERDQQRKLCRSLELIADQLPNEVDRSLCQKTYDKLRSKLPIYHQNEEALFGLIGRRASRSMGLDAILTQVSEEHAIHNCYAEEFYELLDALNAQRHNQNYDMIGYMLRCFFETIRRHLQWEELTLMPLAEHALTARDLTKLYDIVANNRGEIGLDFG